MSINLGFHHLLVYNVDLPEWCDRYELEQFVGECMDCGSPMEVNLPFAGKGIRGLRAAQCLCGNTCVSYIRVDLGFGEGSLNSLGGFI